MSDDDPKPIDPMEAVLERRRELLRQADRNPAPGFRRARILRGDYEMRRRKRGAR